MLACLPARTQACGHCTRGAGSSSGGQRAAKSMPRTAAGASISACERQPQVINVLSVHLVWLVREPGYRGGRRDIRGVSGHLQGRPAQVERNHVEQGLALVRWQCKVAHPLPCHARVTGHSRIRYKLRAELQPPRPRLPAGRVRELSALAQSVFTLAEPGRVKTMSTCEWARQAASQYELTQTCRRLGVTDACRRNYSSCMRL